MLTDTELAQAYTATCHAVSEAGERSELYLARLSLLLMKELGDPKRIQAAISQAQLSD